jgi:hypothetical protein
MELKVSGAMELDALARRLREAGDRTLLTELRRGLTKATKPIGPAIQGNLRGHIPSGFRPTLSKALRFKTSVKTQGRLVAVTFVVTAEGSKEMRKVGAMDEGTLRHPVWGRYRYSKQGSRRKNPWVAQKIRPGFASGAFTHQVTNIRRTVVASMHDVAQKITKE